MTPAEAVRALAAIHDHGEQIRQQELEIALQKIDDLDDDQRATVEALADRMVEQVLEAPTRSLLTAAVENDEETVATALSLFVDGESVEREADCSSPGKSIPEFARAQD
ncbi:hypothetical protein [Halapricum salinum]|uniref:Tetrapyrrole biosynthesis glutamyl-tRNA reductase dimerisation domain-containing protein n=1 Tax=Halapricum salinum TaxID=1457250 RepID=A0A4D6HF56_9EURY|nr:hypothetical protein [Halapricum salinum]QCC51926.1 hypothetical protein DV733_12110 [Halapricum salinum]